MGTRFPFKKGVTNREMEEIRRDPVVLNWNCRDKCKLMGFKIYM